MREQTQTQIQSPLLSKYLKAYKKNPRSHVFAPLAETYRQMGRLDSAIAILKEGIKYNPAYFMGHSCLASCYFDRGQYLLAYNILYPLVPLHRDNIMVQKMFAQLCLKLDKKEEALDTYKYLLFLNPRDQESAEQIKTLENLPFSTPIKEESYGIIDEDMDAWAELDLTAAPSQQHDVEREVEREIEEEVEEIGIEAEAEVEVEERGEEIPLATHALVELYQEQGYLKKAIEVLERICEFNPEDCQAQEKLDQLKAIDPNIDLGEEFIGIENEENPGEKNLMDLYDHTLKNVSKNVSKNEGGLREDDSGKAHLLEKRMQSFLSALQERASSFRER